jgi:hypothetical protein
MRGGLGRIGAMAIGLAVMLALVLADAARAGNYYVAQCGWGVGAELDPAVPRAEGVGAALHPGYCTAPLAGAPLGLGFDLGPADDGEPGVARARWVAPPGTSFTGVYFNWSGELQRAVWQVAGIDDGSELRGVAIGAESSPLHPVVANPIGPAPAFEVRLECRLFGSSGCTRSAPSKALLSELMLTVTDPVPPTARLGGDLAAPGWHRGKLSLQIDGEDPAGGGLYGELAKVDGAVVGSTPITCATVIVNGMVRGARLRPCPPTASLGFEVDTKTLADGAHRLRGCAVDFSGGVGCAPEAQLLVDNSPPSVEFAAAPEGQVAATVSDPSSGPATGTISVRGADSGAWSDLPTTFEPGAGGSATLRAQLPDLGGGAYVARATATDAAGNSASAELRASGRAAEAKPGAPGGDGKSGADGKDGRSGGSGKRGEGGAPGAHGVRGVRGEAGGRRATHLVARLVGGGRPDRQAPRAEVAADRSDRSGGGGSRLTVDYGAPVEVRGRLTDSHGAGVAGRSISVVARAVGGFGGAPERRRVVTDRGGRFALRLPTGTSRRVTVAFHGGGGFAAAPGRPLALRVRAAVSLAAAPPSLNTGEKVHFVGAVTKGKARIPGRGKLVAIQYLDRESNRWRPALVIRTGADGHFHVDYRFRYITGAARIRFRATALPEAGWPYAPGSSAPVTVAVHGR